MRQLHAVSRHEHFVASGTYTHYQYNEPTGTAEYWSIHELPDGGQIIRVDDDWREHDGSSVLIEAWRSPETRQIERFDLQAFGGKRDTINEVRASFQVFKDHLEIGRSVDKNEREQFELVLPEQYITAPESLIFGGFEVVALAQFRGDPIPVISYLPTFLTETTAFRPVTHAQSATFLRHEQISIRSKPYDAQVYQQANPSDGTHWPIWVDKHGVLLKFTGPHNIHSAVLTQYAQSIQ